VYRGNEGTAGFLNLPYGKYKLYVRYFNGVSERKEHYNVLEIEVKATWYLTSWAIMLYVLLFILICCVAIRIFFAIYHRKQAQLAARIREQQQEQQFKDRLEFFTNITHEFCTPLTIIQGVCDILKKKNGGNAEMGKYVETLHTNTSHLNTLVQELLDFRQIEEGAFRKINVRMAPINSIIRRWSSSYEEIAANNDIRFSVSVVPQDLLWSTDTSCLGKILTNLISNAFKYTPVGGEVRISAEVFNDHLHISVYNTGMGMSEEEKKSIFNRYEILNDMSRNGYRDMSERHGLGLAICQKMVEILNGTITVDSVKGEYARFEVVLPSLKPKQNDAAALESADEKMPVVDLPENATPKVMLSETKLKMLVVDDNKEILRFYKDLLSDEYSISSATSVGEAMHQIETNQPNIIITDIMMPDQSGVDFIGMVRGNRYTEHIPIIVVSAKVRETDQVEGIEKGADAYITKPFSGAVLKSMVKRIVDRERSARNYYTSPESAYIKHEGMVISNADKEFLDSVLKIISENIEDEDALRPAEIASKLGIDPRTLYRKFKKISPLTPNDFVKNYRYNLATKLLRTTDLSIQEIIYKVGVSNKTSFYADFKKLYGMTPTEYRNQKE
jgi:signal transduction histidine kinase/DNA-binding response OmpR family regulator